MSPLWPVWPILASRALQNVFELARATDEAEIPRRIWGLIMMRFLCLVVLGLAAMLTSCISVTKQRSDRVILDASQEGDLEGTGTSSSDIRSMAERMAREIAGINWNDNMSMRRIAFVDIDNQTRFPLNPNIIKDRLLADLMEFTSGLSLRFSEEKAGADYLLSLRITALSKGSHQGVNDYLLYSFKLVDRENTLIWMKTYETKKQGKTGIMYR